jgi:serine/threonine protein kinase
MPLAVGSRLAAYEIVSLLGAGGMGEVHRARDTKLDRDVAIKVLPEPFVADPERVARFQREAKTLAALNHPGCKPVAARTSLQVSRLRPELPAAVWPDVDDRKRLTRRCTLSVQDGLRLCG